MHKTLHQVAAEIKAQTHQVKAAVELLDDGATVPFIARYRKEATGGLDDIQLRELEYRLGYLRELTERREAVLKSIEEQGKLTPELRAAVDLATTKQDLEDLYLPYKFKRRTKGQIAREAGIEPLADALFSDPMLVPADEASAYVKAEKNESDTHNVSDFTTVQAVLDGVRDILSERWAEDAALVQSLRHWLWSEGLFSSRLAIGSNFRQDFPTGEERACQQLLEWTVVHQKNAQRRKAQKARRVPKCSRERDKRGRSSREHALARGVARSRARAATSQRKLQRQRHGAGAHASNVEQW